MCWHSHCYPVGNNLFTDRDNKMKLIKSIIATCAIAGFAASPLVTTDAEASIVSYADTFTASSAVSDPALAKYNNDHAIWLPFFRTLAGTPLQGNADAASFDFVWDGSLEFDSSGNGTLSGSIQSQVDSDFGFDVVFNFSAVSGPGADGPKLELFNSAYVANGGSIDPSTWDFFTLTSGTFTGVDSLAGLNFDVEQRGSFPLQLGVGANGKNGNLGASVWFNLYTSSTCENSLCNALDDMTLRGDINIDVAPVPVPGAFLLFGTGLVGFGAARRKKAKDAV